ncbi:phage tail sheath family protein [Pseudocnuella soli]|uniref:phage tail sheath family protein n=1 Tax=Pseudocnuella soli TaxID=2502779 RepID=UPI00104FCB78|nr:phage tail sheath C-terminal domain-containing protein [Pseudocnuella soli]
MATIYKTPGVYIDEIPKLPPSVAQVETAIPAFIGYTEKADELSPGDLNKKPKRIGSLVEYELFFGYGPSPDVTEVNLDNNNNFLFANLASSYFLYDSLRLFYANGGGDCYIVSVGRYSATPSEGDFTNGLAEVAKLDEPTILLFPDAVRLEDSPLSNVQKAALAQCGDLQDRFSVFDVRQTDPQGVAFKNNIGINFLRYGAAYTPWLKVAMPKAVKFSNLFDGTGTCVIKRSGIVTDMAGLTTDADLQTKITELKAIYADVKKLDTETTALGVGSADLWTNYNALEAAFNAAPDGAKLNALFTYIYSIATKLGAYTTGGTALQFDKLKDDVTGAISSNFIPVFTQVRGVEKELDDDAAITYSLVSLAALSDDPWAPVKTATAGDMITDTLEEEDKLRQAAQLLRPLFEQLNRDYIGLINDTATNYARNMDTSLELTFPVYKNILAGIRNSMTSMPPSGAIAGVYSMVDRTRGVWKAPANVSLTNVLGPEVSFTKTELDALNVDAVAGKSINAIRAFFGKGTLVFGARTLAGNDNEWRYVSVRRFFNMVEESAKKATEPFVFEPNDANTWVKVQGMLDNYLITLWRQGALQGAKPEHAFYVAVGLGKTMTALDILEGRMIVEIGLAVVRPAEFIILRFSHKLAES